MGRQGWARCPSKEAELEEVVLDVDIADLDEEEEEVEGFSGHPCQGAEEAGMQQGSDAPWHWWAAVSSAGSCS